MCKTDSDIVPTGPSQMNTSSLFNGHIGKKTKQNALCVERKNVVRSNAYRGPRILLYAEKNRKKANWNVARTSAVCLVFIYVCLWFSGVGTISHSVLKSAVRSRCVWL